MTEPKTLVDCECELPGYFHSGVPGILARVVDERLAETKAQVERCDGYECYPSDDAAYAKLVELGIAKEQTNAKHD